MHKQAYNFDMAQKSNWIIYGTMSSVESKPSLFSTPI